jgi:hypothetical protein
MIKTQLFKDGEFSATLLFRFLFDLNFQRPWAARRCPRFSFRLAESLAKLRPMFATRPSAAAGPSALCRRAAKPADTERAMNMVKLAAATGVFLLLAGVAAARELREYDSESAAQKHCPKDTVVWSNVKGGGLFHVKGSKLYGRTSDGGYLCRREAEDAGWHEYVRDDRR